MLLMKEGFVMLVIAHRSGPVICPEQTVASGKHALECGADLIEVDVRTSSDGKLIVSHDGNASRVFGVDKDVSEMTADEYCSLVHKSGSGYRGQLLEDYLSSGILNLVVHVKEKGDTVFRTIDILKRYGAFDSSVLGITSTGEIRLVREKYPEARILAFMRSPDDIDEAVGSGADYIRLWEKWVTPERVSRIKASGRKVWIMVGTSTHEGVGITTREFLEYIYSLGVDGILINDVSQA